MSEAIFNVIGRGADQPACMGRRVQSRDTAAAAARRLHDQLPAMVVGAHRNLIVWIIRHFRGREYNTPEL